MSELKPCPFCGGKAWYWTRGTRYGHIAWIECETCGCKTKAVSTKLQVDDAGFEQSTPVKVLDAIWNRRAYDATD